MYINIIKEYGFFWLFNRFLYAVKIKFLQFFPVMDFLFEKNNQIKRLDIIEINEKIIEKFLDNLPLEKKQEIISIADNAIEGKILTFSNKTIDYGSPIDWHTHPISKITIDKNKKWFQIPDFDKDRGDVKYIWEASRFSHFYYLSRAFMITKNKKYYKAFSEQLDDWLINNKYSYGINYKDGQEASLRMINTLIVYTIFRKYRLTTEKDKTNVYQLVNDSLRKVNSNFFYAYRSVKNNHTLSEIAAKIVGYYCSDNDIKLNKAYSLLNKVLDEQFMDDGGYIQKSFNYQRFALHIVEFILSISDKTKNKISDSNKEKITKSILQLYNLTNGNGRVPNYGHNDGALVFPVTSCDYQDYRPVINSLYSLLEQTRLYPSGIYDEEILWFHNEDHNNKFYPVARKNSSYKNSGLYYFYQKKTQLMIIINDYHSRPAHMDQLHVDIWHNGLNIFCDLGTYSYATELGKRNILNRAHNTVQLNDLNQMSLLGNFFVHNWSKPKFVEHKKGYFKGVVTSKSGYVHEREMILSEDFHKIRINDKVITEKENNKITFLLHTPCEISVTNNKAVLSYNGKEYAEISTTGKILTEPTFSSLYYYHKKKINKIIISSFINTIKTQIILY